MSVSRIFFAVVLLCGSFLSSLFSYAAEAAFIYDELYKDIRPILYPGSLYGIRSDSPEFTDKSANWLMVETLKAKYGDPDFLNSEEYSRMAARITLLRDLESMIATSYAGVAPAALTGVDLGLLVRQNWLDQMKKLEKKPDYKVVDVYANSQRLKYTWLHLLFMMENGKVPLKFKELNVKEGFISWMHEYIHDRTQLQMFYRVAMSKAATTEDLGVFIAGFIDVTREIEGMNFEKAWRQWIRDEVRAAAKRLMKMPDWVWVEVYPNLLKDGRQKEESNSPYVYGFRESLHSYLELTRIEGSLPRLAGLNSDAELKASVQMVMTSILNREIANQPAWEKATMGSVEWLLPEGQNVRDIQNRLQELVKLEGVSFRDALQELISDMGTAGADAFSLRGALWNMSFQIELQRFLMKNAMREILSVDQFFQLSNYVANQKMMTRIYVSYIGSLDHLDDYHLASFKFYQRVGRDLGWVKFRNLDESPNFREEAPILSAALWQKYHDLQTYDVSKDDWIRDTWMNLLGRRKISTHHHLGNFNAMMLRTEPLSFFGVLTAYLDSPPESDWAIAMAEHYGKHLQFELESLSDRALERAVECESLLLIAPPKS